MTQTQVKVIGAARLRRTLRAAGDDLSDLKAVHQQVGGIVAERARALVPRRSGALGASIRASRGATAAIVRAGSGSVPYAGPIHWGWPARNIAAQPFLSDGATSTESRWMNVYEAAIAAALAKVEGA